MNVLAFRISNMHAWAHTGHVHKCAIILHVLVNGCCILAYYLLKYNIQYINWVQVVHNLAFNVLIVFGDINFFCFPVHTYTRMAYVLTVFLINSKQLQFM